MLGELLLLWAAAFPLMGSPGPATLSVAAMGAAYGPRRALSYLAGICAGTFCVLLMVATGITALILAVPSLVMAITMLAGLYILYLAFRIATAPVGVKAVPKTSRPSFSAGFLLAVANPKAFAAIGAVYSGTGLFADSPVVSAVATIAALAIVIVAVNSAWMVAGSALSSLLGHPVAGRVANIVFALLLLLSVALAVLPDVMRW